jgi:pilus assembly protein Flp/PilA
VHALGCCGSTAWDRPDRELDSACAHVDKESYGMRNFVARFVKDESGASAIEYGLIAALVAVGIITAARALGSQLSTIFGTLSSVPKND